MRYAVFYALVTENVDVGIFVDSPFLAGITMTSQDADALARDISNDKSLGGVAITKILPFQDLGWAASTVSRQFTTMAREMYESEDQLQRKRHHEPAKKMHSTRV